MRRGKDLRQIYTGICLRKNQDIIDATDEGVYTHTSKVAAQVYPNLSFLCKPASVVGGGVGPVLQLE